MKNLQCFTGGVQNLFKGQRFVYDEKLRDTAATKPKETKLLTAVELFRKYEAMSDYQLKGLKDSDLGQFSEDAKTENTKRAGANPELTPYLQEANYEIDKKGAEFSNKASFLRFRSVVAVCDVQKDDPKNKVDATHVYDKKTSDALLKRLENLWEKYKGINDDIKIGQSYKTRLNISASMTEIDSRAEVIRAAKKFKEADESYIKHYES